MNPLNLTQFFSDKYDDTQNKGNELMVIGESGNAGKDRNVVCDRPPWKWMTIVAMDRISEQEHGKNR